MIYEAEIGKRIRDFRLKKISPYKYRLIESALPKDAFKYSFQHDGIVFAGLATG